MQLPPLKSFYRNLVGHHPLHHLNDIIKLSISYQIPFVCQKFQIHPLFLFNLIFNFIVFYLISSLISSFSILISFQSPEVVFPPTNRLLILHLIQGLSLLGKVF